MTTFRGQTAVITGASRGIGMAVALELACRGVGVCLVARDAEALERVAEAARSRGASAACFPADLARDDQIEDVVRRLRQANEAVDLLVHAAGVLAMGPTESMPVSHFDHQYRVNVRAPYALTQALLPMLKSRRGQIAFLNSSIVQGARAGLGPYAATKCALKALADSLRDEVNGDEVRVISVYLGRTATSMQAAVYQWEGRDYRPEVLLQPQDVAALLVHAFSLPRTAEVTDLRIRPLRGPSHRSPGTT